MKQVAVPLAACGFWYHADRESEPQATTRNRLTAHRGLVTLGTLSTLLMLLFPTFFQQALSSNLQFLDRNGTSTFTTARRYLALDQPAPVFQNGHDDPEWLDTGEGRS